MELKVAPGIRLEAQTTPQEDPWPEWLEEDLRWRVARSVVASRQFVKSPLLSKFLLYVVAETMAGRESEITEHQIGVQVFGRPATYRTVEDNIVRNYARQLRKRLSEHFAQDGRGHALRIEIPLGGYVPVFTEAADGQDDEGFAPQPVLLESGAARLAKPRSQRAGVLRLTWPGIVLRAALLLAYSAALVWLTWRVTTHAPASRAVVHEPAQMLWQIMLGGSSNTYVVPSDAGLNLIEDLARHPVPLASYIKGDYRDSPLPQFDEHSATDLRTQPFTAFSSLQIVTALNRLPEYDPQRVFLRFPRDLRFDDLKDANAIILGSVCSNPWAAIADGSTNFHIVCSEGMQSSTIVNAKPQAGEDASYVSHWNEPAHATYALISFLPNLSGNGHLLLVQGLDVAGTQAAAEALLHADAMTSVLSRARRPDGSLRSFEVLLRASSIQSNATDTQVIAVRIR